MLNDERIETHHTCHSKIVKKAHYNLGQPWVALATVLISSHILGALSKLATHYGFIEKGHIVKEISADELEAVCRKCVKVEVSDTKALSDGDFAVTMTNVGEITFSNTVSELSSVDVGKLFDRFYTVDSARKSTGLDLSIAKLLTERMGGHISADYRGNMLSITLSFE